MKPRSFLARTARWLLLAAVVGWVACEAFAQSPSPSVGPAGNAMAIIQHRPTASPASDDPAAAIQHKLTTLIIPRLEFHNTPLVEAIDRLRKEALRLDHDPDRATYGINIFLKTPADAPAVPPVPINLTLKNISMLEAMQYVALQAGLEMKVEPWAVSFTPAHASTEPFSTREFQVPPNVKFSPIGGSMVPDPNAILTVDNARQWLEAQGVVFPPGASATYSPTTRKLIVRDTPQDLSLVGLLLVSPTPSPTPP